MDTEKYRLLDSGNFMKLEQVGPYRLARPALNAAWAPELGKAEWERGGASAARKNRGSFFVPACKPLDCVIY